MNIVEKLSREFVIQGKYAANIVELINDGNTIPFIARYRKEMTGSCDDQVLREFADRHKYLVGLENRKTEVKAIIEEQGKWNSELEAALNAAETMTEVEDIYRPYKQKKKTRASVAIARGLQPLADIVLSQEIRSGDPLEYSKDYVNPENEVNTPEEALKGACDIIAEVISDNAELRKTLREYLTASARIATKLLDKENSKTYDMYAEYDEPISKIPSHRILAINRGENEDCLKVSTKYEEEKCYEKVKDMFVRGQSIFTDLVNNCCEDAFDRLIFPSVEREIRNNLTEKANEQAIKVFESNLRPLLMQPPLKGKVILALDPAYRTGCKIAVIDNSGNVLDTTVVYPTPPQSRVEEATAKLKSLIEKHKVDVISIGNGTASKEAEIFVAALIKTVNRQVTYAVVNEAGASVYSASKLGAEEFPEFDVSLRSAVSIGRRLQDPLAELIKIDVKSIGVGQYQHDMPQNRLSEVLNGVVESCVNSVGVDLNTASPSLLTFVAGLNSGIAKKIVEYRKEKPFTSREELLKVSKLGAKTFEQCAGFLRIPNGKNVLDNTAVHPESYLAVQKLLKRLNYTENDILSGEIKTINTKLVSEGAEKVAEYCGVGVPTLNDIVNELVKPGRDIRDSLPPPVLRADLMDIKDLRSGMEIEGVVRNVIDFGVFIDIGVHQDGLVHISQIADGYIKHPSEVLSVGQKVLVCVLEVDTVKNKISLTLKTSAFPQGLKTKSNSSDRTAKVKSVEKEESVEDLLAKLKSRFSKKKS